jgi:CRISPR-associated protein Cmr2
MADRQYFHFTLGPVQGFVAQARRTRDFWAGSFLLSWLSGVAMAAVRRQQGQIQFPVPPAHYLDWIEGKGQGQAPRQGGIPNRFKSMRAQVPAEFDSQQVVSAVREAWQALAEHVWRCDRLEQIASLGSNTRAIWDRQHASFWDLSWVLTDDESETSVLDQRKNWRSHGFDSAEGGVKCMVMDGWQELSGADKPGRQEKEQAFWQALRASGISGIGSDLADKEQLCALAYVKRRFARHFASFEATLPGSGLRLKGWELSPSVPSVSYMAAVHWLEALLKQGQADELRELLQQAQAVSAERNEWDTQIRCLREAVPYWDASQAERQLLALDGNLFFEHVQLQPKAYGYDPQRMKDWRNALKDFGRQHPDLGAPSPFYAILLMDGDSLGSHMSDQNKQGLISNALLNFTHGPAPGQDGAVEGSVPEIVERHNGFLIYAGGDDVLAILPLEDALGCAAEVRQHYLNCFKHSGIPTTISAAIEFAHVKTPLGQVLGDAHKLLDDVAKDGAGRDALAVRVWKTSGMVLEWAQPWQVVLQGGRSDAPVVVQQLASRFEQPVPLGSGHEVRFSSKFFFKIEEHFAVLNPPDAKSEPILSEQEAQDLLAVDFWASADNRAHLTLAEVGPLIQPLLEQCRPCKRLLDKPKEAWPRSKKLKADGALLVRFLATKGLEQGDQR